MRRSRADSREETLPGVWAAQGCRPIGTGRQGTRERAVVQLAVTGGGGFIGSHVVDRLVRAGHDVRVIDVQPRWRNPEATYLEVDLFDQAGLGAAVADCAAVFHLAGASNV